MGELWRGGATGVKACVWCGVWGRLVVVVMLLALWQSLGNITLVVVCNCCDVWRWMSFWEDWGFEKVE